MYYTYIWGGGRYRIANAIMVQSIDNGGFKMIDSTWQENSLKLAWLQRLLADETNAYFWMVHVKNCIRVVFSEFVQLNLAPKHSTIRKFIKEGSRLPQYWFDVLVILFRWTYVKDLCSCNFVKSLPICFNSALGAFQNHLMMITYQNFKNVNIFTIRDFLESKISVHVKLQIKWFEMFDSLPTGILQNLDFGFEKSPFFDLYKGGMRPKDCVSLFRELKDHRNDKAIAKWSLELELPNIDGLWSSLCRKATLLPNRKLSSFHVEFLNRAFMLNNARSKFSNISPMCPRCNKELDSFPHFYWECKSITKIWSSIIDAMDTVASVDENPRSKANCVLSNFNSPLLVTITVLFKKYLLQCKWFNNTVSIQEFFKSLLQLRNRHFKKCKYQSRTRKHFIFWDVLINDSFFDDYI